LLFRHLDRELSLNGSERRCSRWMRRGYVVCVGRGNTEGFVPLDNPSLAARTSPRQRLGSVDGLPDEVRCPAAGGPPSSADGGGNGRCLREGRKVSSDLRHALRKRG